MGFASPASDVYGLGMTIVYMLTGKSPSDMDLDGLTVDYEGYLPSSVPMYMRQLLRMMLKPDLDERMESMRGVLMALDGLQCLQVSVPPNAHSTIEVEQSLYEDDQHARDSSFSEGEDPLLSHASIRKIADPELHLPSCTQRHGMHCSERICTVLNSVGQQRLLSSIDYDYLGVCCSNIDAKKFKI